MWGDLPLPTRAPVRMIGSIGSLPQSVTHGGLIMFSLTRTRGRRWALTAALAIVAAGAGLIAVPLTASASPKAELGVGQVGTRAEIPWRSIGPGWALAVFSASSGGEGLPAKAGPSTLYLVDPAGGRYTVATWPAESAQKEWTLEAWSGDASRALFISGVTRETVHQFQLRTGEWTTFRLPKNVSVVGYTRPDGLNILAIRSLSDIAPAKASLVRYSLTGGLQRKLATVTGLGGVAYQPAGAELAAGNLKGLELIGNAGGVIRSLPVPGTKYGCNAVRWWSPGTILADCQSRMWLVPASGAKPTALTPVRKGSTFDFGDFDAWKLSSGLYLDAYGACGTLNIGYQPAHGPERQVMVPGSDSSLIITATSHELMVLRIGPCESHNSLVWFNPVTKAMKVVVPVTGHQAGVIYIVPYFVTGKF
jgi:hypothetical protein